MLSTLCPLSVYDTSEMVFVPSTYSRYKNFVINWVHFGTLIVMFVKIGTVKATLYRRCRYQSTTQQYLKRCLIKNDNNYRVRHLTLPILEVG